MKNLLIIIILIFPNFMVGQGWEKTFSDSVFEYGSEVHETNDGGYVIIGLKSLSYWDSSYVYLIKTDSYGDSLWAKTFGGNDIDVGTSGQQTTDLGYIITGWTNSYGNGDDDVYLIKTDIYGDTLWTKTYGLPWEDRGAEVKQTTDGGYIITGHTFWGPGDCNLWLIKTDSQGDTLWTKTHGGGVLGSNTQVGSSVYQTNDGGYIVTGYTNSFGNGYRDIYLIKTDSLGDLLWETSYGDIYDDNGFSVQQTSDGGFIIVGNTMSPLDHKLYIYLIKADALGVVTWTKTYGGNAGSIFEHTSDVKQTTDDGYIIAGTADLFGNGSNDVYLIKTDTYGDTLWTRTFGGSNRDFGSSVYQTTDGGYIITGSTYSNLGYSAIYLIKTDSLGYVNSPPPTSVIISQANSSKKVIKTFDMTGREIIPKKNIPFIELYDDGSVKKKIVVE